MKILKPELIIGVILIIASLSSCEEGKSLQDRLNGISENVKKVENTLEKTGKGLSKVAKGLEGYVDTTKYYKDSSGVWRNKMIQQPDSILKNQ